MWSNDQRSQYRKGSWHTVVIAPHHGVHGWSTRNRLLHLISVNDCDQESWWMKTLHLLSLSEALDFTVVKTQMVAMPLRNLVILVIWIHIVIHLQMVVPLRWKWLVLSLDPPHHTPDGWHSVEGRVMRPSTWTSWPWFTAAYATTGFSFLLTLISAILATHSTNYAVASRLWCVIATGTLTQTVQFSLTMH